jgi:hypothetical protein
LRKWEGKKCERIWCRACARVIMVRRRQWVIR